MKRNIVNEIVSSLLILLFVYTGISKLAYLAMFKNQLDSFMWLKPFSNFLAIGIPVLELIISTLLLFQKTKVIGLYSALVLLTLFTCYLTFMLRYQDHLPCSCGGVIQELTWKQHLIFNLSFILITAYSIFLSKRRFEKAIV